MKTPQSEPVLGSRLRLERRKGRRKVPKLRICPPGPPVTREFRARCLAYLAYYYFRQGISGQKDPHWFAAVCHKAARAGDKLFIHYLDKYLKGKPPRPVLSEDQIKLIEFYYKKPHLSASEALKELDYPSKGTYRGAKRIALERSRLWMQISGESM
jgi:hypothetical protein